MAYQNNDSYLLHLNNAPLYSCCRYVGYTILFKLFEIIIFPMKITDYNYNPKLQVINQLGIVVSYKANEVRETRKWDS